MRLVAQVPTVAAKSRKESDMSEAITYEERRRELANRVFNGIEVTLL